MAIVFNVGDVGPTLGPADPYGKLAAAAAGAAAARASAMTSTKARVGLATVAGMSTGTKIAIGGGVAALLVFLVSRRAG